MATQSMIPLHLSGNTTERQNSQLQASLGEAAEQACRIAINQLDSNRAQVVLDLQQRLKAELIDSIVGIIHQHTVSDKLKGEEIASARAYPPRYKIRPLEAQVTELGKLFPPLGGCMERLSWRPLIEGAEAWFAIPRWQ